MESIKKEITIKTIYKNTERKDGTKLVTSKGDPYMKVTIKTINDTTLYRNSFRESDISRLWDDGETHQVLVEQNGEYLNFTPADAPNNTDKLLREILKEIKEIKRNKPTENPFDGLDETEQAI